MKENAQGNSNFLSRVVGIAHDDPQEARLRFTEAFPETFFAQDPVVAAQGLETAISCNLSPVAGEQIRPAQEGWQTAVVVFSAEVALQAGTVYPQIKEQAEYFMGHVGARLLGLNRLGTEVGVTENNSLAGKRALNRINDRSQFSDRYSQALEARDPAINISEEFFSDAESAAA